MNSLDMHGVGEDAGLHMLMQRLDELRHGVRELKASMGSQGVSYSVHDLTFANGGNLSGYGGGDIDWSGSAHFSGETTIDGNLNLAAGIIGSVALDQQILPDGGEATTKTRAANNATWITLATHALTIPDWAASCHVMMTGSMKHSYGTNMVGNPTLEYRVGIEGDWGPQLFPIPDEGGFLSGNAPWMRSWPSNPPPTVSCSIQGRRDNTGAPPHANDLSLVSVVALYLR